MFLKASLDAVRLLEGLCLLLFINLSTQDVQIRITGPKNPVPIGSNITLKCYTQLNSQHRRLQNMAFEKDRKLSAGSPKNPQQISILSVQKSDAGRYKCSSVTTSGGHSEQFYVLNVTAQPRLEHAEYKVSLPYPPDDKFPPVGRLFISGDNIGPYNFTAPPGMSLEVTEQSSTFKQIPITNYYLTPIFDVKESPAGMVGLPSICDTLARPSGLYHFWFTNQPINVTFQLDVHYRATWGGSSRNMTAFLGDVDVHITCDVCANPKVVHQWMLNSVPLNISTRTLIIETVGPSDFGVYQCTATNTNGVFERQTFNITLSEERSKAIDMGNKVKDINSKAGGDPVGGRGGGGIPAYVYPIIAGMVLLLLVAIAIYNRRRSKRPDKRSRALKEDEESPAEVFEMIPLSEKKLLPVNEAEPIYENGPANHRPYIAHAVPIGEEPTNKQQPELTYCQLDFDSDDVTSGSPQKELRVQVPRAAEEYTEYAEITGILVRSK